MFYWEFFFLGGGGNLVKQLSRFNLYSTEITITTAFKFKNNKLILLTY
jgi:hypothetical protein